MRRIDGSRRALSLLAAVIVGAGAAGAAEPPKVTPPVSPVAPAKTPVAPATTAMDKTPAKQLFGSTTAAAPLKARAIGFYSKGCLAGGRQLAVDGPAWQAMRLSRNRNWGHPELVRLVERLAKDVKQKDAWPGLLVGDLAQPRGGPMLTGHASHQIGLDADIWLTPMPDRRLTREERESMSAVSMLGDTPVTVGAAWTAGHVKLIRRAALYPEVERVLVHPAIKKALCVAAGDDRKWLHKVRPYWGHHYHMHIRIGCPKDSPTCRGQKLPEDDEGCGAELDRWFKILSRPAPPVVVPKDPPKPVKPPRPMMLSDLPAECREVLTAGP